VVLQEDSKHTTSSGEIKDLVGGGDDGAWDSVVGLAVAGMVGLAVVTTAVVVEDGESVEGTGVTPGGAGVATPPGTEVVAGAAVLGAFGCGVVPPLEGDAVVITPGDGVAGVAGAAVLVVVLVEGFGVVVVLGPELGTAVVEELGELEVVEGAIVVLPGGNVVPTVVGEAVVEVDVTAGFGVVAVVGRAVVPAGAGVALEVGTGVGGAGLSPGIGIGVGGADGVGEVG
jgi:hypothetical protein